MRKLISACVIATLPAFFMQTADPSAAQKGLRGIMHKSKAKSPQVLNGYIDSLFIVRKYLDSVKMSNTVKVKELEKINAELKTQDSVITIITDKTKKDDLY